MPRLKLTAAPDDKPVRITIDLPAETHRMLAAYAEAMSRESGQPVDPVKLVLDEKLTASPDVDVADSAGGATPRV